MELTGKSIVISGVVQGVGFRYSASKAAKRLGVKGFVRNLSDGTVLICAEGKPIQVNNLIKWCYDGPIGARVSDVSITTKEIEGFEDFSIRHF
jgi:acylphosphatase